MLINSLLLMKHLIIQLELNYLKKHAFVNQLHMTRTQFLGSYIHIQKHLEIFIVPQLKLGDILKIYHMCTIFLLQLNKQHYFILSYFFNELSFLKVIVYPKIQFA